MSTTNPIAKRFREVIFDGKFVAYTNYKDQLSQVKLAEATQKVGSLNTIAALTYHINYYVAGVLNVFEGGGLEIRDKFSFDLPTLKSEDDWEKLKNDLFSNADKFAAHLDTFTEEKYKEGFVDKKYGTYRRNIDGMIEHCYYHLGQVSIIRKMIAEGM
ncbi:MAG: DUF1572 domain-containing protein [Bacteroidota bacterium]